MKAKPLKNPARGRPPQISRAKILAAALKLKPAELSMPRIAAGLGVATTALYRYFPSRADLLAALSIELLRDLPVRPPDPAHWRDWLRQAMLDYYRHLCGNPLIVHALDAHITVPTPFDHLEAVLQTLTGAGFKAGQAYEHALGAGFIARYWASLTVSVKEERAGNEIGHVKAAIEKQAVVYPLTAKVLATVDAALLDRAFLGALDNLVRGIPDPVPQVTATRRPT